MGVEFLLFMCYYNFGMDLKTFIEMLPITKIDISKEEIIKKYMKQTKGAVVFGIPLLWVEYQKGYIPNLLCVKYVIFTEVALKNIKPNIVLLKPSEVLSFAQGFMKQNLPAFIKFIAPLKQYGIVNFGILVSGFNKKTLRIKLNIFITLRQSIDPNWLLDFFASREQTFISILNKALSDLFEIRDIHWIGVKKYNVKNYTLLTVGGAVLLGMFLFSMLKK